ncbi:hypothetical protein AGLY_007357, partial [Aphis glycines]
PSVFVPLIHVVYYFVAGKASHYGYRAIGKTYLLHISVLYPMLLLNCPNHRKLGSTQLKSPYSAIAQSYKLLPIKFKIRIYQPRFLLRLIITRCLSIVGLGIPHAGLEPIYHEYLKKKKRITYLLGVIELFFLYLRLSQCAVKAHFRGNSLSSNLFQLSVYSYGYTPFRVTSGISSPVKTLALSRMFSRPGVIRFLASEDRLVTMKRKVSINRIENLLDTYLVNEIYFSSMLGVCRSWTNCGKISVQSFVFAIFDYIHDVELDNISPIDGNGQLSCDEVSPRVG